MAHVSFLQCRTPSKRSHHPLIAKVLCFTPNITERAVFAKWPTFTNYMKKIVTNQKTIH